LVSKNRNILSGSGLNWLDARGLALAKSNSFGDAPKLNLGSQSRLTLNLGSEQFLKNILYLSGFSWPDGWKWAIRGTVEDLTASSGG